MKLYLLLFKISYLNYFAPSIHEVTSDTSEPLVATIELSRCQGLE